MYSYKGISTNNLKNISVGFEDHEIVYIGGVSGSGKSSLAFDTIAAISENEYGSLVNDNKASVRYRIEKYGNVLVAATLKQLNFNVNPRSIILTYFGLYQHMANIFSQCTHISADNFSLNGPNRYRRCNGIGYVRAIDEILVVDPKRTIKEGPFRCWNASYSDFFSQLLHHFCQERNIDESKRFGELDKNTQEILLRSKGNEKYKIEYKVGGRKRTKTSTYIGPILGMEMGQNDMFGINKDKYSKQCVCPDCQGGRLTEQISMKKVFGDITVKFMLTESMQAVGKVLKQMLKEIKSESLEYSCDYMIQFIKACRRLNVSYLNLSRSISTLSGGELQRLRMVQLLLGKLKNLMIVLDEPTGSLDQKETDSIIKIIKELRANNTIIVVDHNDVLRNISDRSFFLGPKSGIHGGQLIEESEYLKRQEGSCLTAKKPVGKAIELPLQSEYVDFSGKLVLYYNSLNGLSGPSGIGKSTILRDILPYQLDGYKYISQKPIKTNRNSTVATYTELLDEVRKYYASKTKKDKKLFSLSQEGACPCCGGKGAVLIGDFYNEQIYSECEECGGSGYAKKTLEQKVNGLSIYEFLSQNIGDIIESGIFISKQFDKTVRLLSKLGLGHLPLNQKISSLSGGENQRIKLSRALGESRTKIFGLDEPSKGLGRREIIDLVSVIYENIEQMGKTFIVSEHNTEFLEMCANVCELVRDKKKVVVRKR